MADPSNAHAQLAWLEIEGGNGTPLRVHCPRADVTKNLQECLACKRYTTLAIHPNGKHIYVTCEPSVELPVEAK
jgi:hypothetical protein